MASASSKLEYLKKYTSDAKEPSEKRKKRKKPFNPKANSGIIVVDNEIEVHKLKTVSAFEDDPYHDNAPTVAEIFDESIPRGMQDSKKWRSVASYATEEGGGGNSRTAAVTVRRESPDSDLSPPRQTHVPSTLKSSKSTPRLPQTSRRRSDDSDLSPERPTAVERSSRRSPAETSSRNRKSSQDTGQREGARRLSSGDLSPVRLAKSARNPRAESSDSDLSPVRPSASASSSKAPSSSAIPKTTLCGMTAGLQSARTLREEADRKRRREEESFETMDVNLSGRNAETVYRDRKTGKRRDMDAEAEVEAEKAARKKVHEDKFKKWGKGLVQGEKHEQNVNDALHEMSKPLARYEDDADRDTLLKAVDREGDPMLEYLKTKKVKSQGDGGRPKYKGPPPAPNRFGILPGYRWDGVDRSNNFEKSRFNRVSNRTATTEQAYKWSTEDM